MNKLYRFMYERYGIDELYYFNIYLYFLLVIGNLFLRIPYFFFVELTVSIFTFYRVFSDRKSVV